MPDNHKISLNGYGHIGRLALSGGDLLLILTAAFIAYKVVRWKLRIKN